MRREDYHRGAGSARPCSSTSSQLACATALKVKDITFGTERSTVSIQRAWKKAKKGAPGGAYYLGAPKTRKARRILRLTPAQEALARRLTAGRPAEAYLFRTPAGKHWRHASANGEPQGGHGEVLRGVFCLLRHGR
ncbi:hypothetical protein GA0115260_109663 [Streptomyces sp. MnatMP-M27]|nr:hypothetical protein GA0115260_109663 [Streptomyces sp. MnatMP-M27]